MAFLDRGRGRLIAGLLASLLPWLLLACAPMPVTLPGFRPEPGRTASLVAPSDGSTLVAFDGVSMEIPLGEWDFIIPPGPHQLTVKKDWSDGWKTPDGRDADLITYAILSFDADTGGHYGIGRTTTLRIYELSQSALPHVYDIDQGVIVSTLVRSWEKQLADD